MNTVFCGPFIGEFGWELCYWHGWLRKLKQSFFKEDHFVVASYPGRYPLYEFADEFVPLPQWFLDKKYSAVNYRVEAVADEPWGSEPVRSDSIKLLDEFKKRFDPEDTIFIHNFPQRVPAKGLDWSKYTNRIMGVFSNPSNGNFERYFKNCNRDKGRLMDQPLFTVALDGFQGTPQRPFNDEQKWVELHATRKGLEARDVLLRDFDLNRPLIPVFPRKRETRRPDKNWEENKWLEFIKLLIGKYDAIVVLCGTPNGAFLTDYQDPQNVINTIRHNPEELLDLQLAFLDASDISVHGRSGSCRLSMQNGCHTLLAAPEDELTRLKTIDNPTGADFYCYTEYGVNPPVRKFFEAFQRYYKELHDRKVPLSRDFAKADQQ